MNGINSLAALARAGLDDLDPAWLPQFDANLVASARQSKHGRYWLAAKLAARFRLFMEPMCSTRQDEPVLPEVTEQAWILRSSDTWCSWLLKLGALSCKDPIRAVVERDEVQRLRAVLGDALYNEIVTPNRGDAPSPVQPRWPRTNEEIATLLQAQGKTALYQYSLWVHPLVAERVGLAFPPATMWMQYDTRLTSAQVECCLAET